MNLLHVGLIVGFVAGWLFGVYLYYSQPVGNLRIDNSDPDEGPQLFLELYADASPKALKNKKKVALRIKAENYISHK